jgi:magnesium transporter
MNKDVTTNPVELTALFPQETAGRDMMVEIPVVFQQTLVKAALDHLLATAHEYKSLNYIYIVDVHKVLKGVISIKELLQADDSKSLKSVMRKDPVVVNPMDSVAHVASLAVRHNVKMLPIVDHKSRIVGAFGSAKLLDILNKEFSNDLLRLSGVPVPQKHFHFDHLKVAFARMPWMIIGMLGGLATGAIIGFYKESIQTIVLLAVFIPVIMSTGATSANQSAMIFLRNLIHGDIKSRVQYLLNELKVSLLLALVLSVILFPILAFYPGDIVLAFAVTVSLFFTVIAGAMVGAVTPMVLNRFKLDPSIGAGPFLTIVKDLIAMTIYFTVSTSILSLFS